MKHLNKKAKISAGRSRCNNCSMFPKGCSIEMLKACLKSHVEGYKKGAKAAENELKASMTEISQFKIGDKVIVSATATGLGDQVGYVCKVETVLGRTLVSVDYIVPDSAGGLGTCVNACHIIRIG